MPIKNLKFIFPILALGVAVTAFVFFGMSQVKAINISGSWMQITILGLVAVFAILKSLTPPALTSVGAGFFVVLN